MNVLRALFFPDLGKSQTKIDAAVKLLQRPSLLCEFLVIMILQFLSINHDPAIANKAAYPPVSNQIADIGFGDVTLVIL